MGLKTFLGILPYPLAQTNDITVSAQGYPQLQGNVVLVPGSDVNIVEAGQNIIISATPTPTPVLTGYTGQADLGPGDSTTTSFNLGSGVKPLDSTQLIGFVDGKFLLPSETSYDSVGNNLVTTFPPAPAQQIAAWWLTGLNGVEIKYEQLTLSGSSVTLSTTPQSSGSIMMIINGRPLPKDLYDVSGATTIDFDDDSGVNATMSICALYQVPGGILDMVQQDFGNAPGGIDLFGQTTYTPNETPSLLAFQSMMRLTAFDYTYNSGYIITGVDPAVGQFMSSYYLFYKNTTGFNTEYITLTQGQVDARQAQLTFSPTIPQITLVDVVRSTIGSLEYSHDGVSGDFQVIDNSIVWSGLAFEADAVAGMRIRVYYPI